MNFIQSLNIARGALADASSQLAVLPTDITSANATFTGWFGIAQQQVSAASHAMTIDDKLLNEHIVALDTVDPFAASTPTSQLALQAETACALGACIQRLSLLNRLC